MKFQPQDEDKRTFPEPREWFDVVDEHDFVICRRLRREVHQLKLLHRAVSIFVRNSKGEMLIHRRSSHKDEYPLLFTSSASGHVSAGEDYDKAAIRELQEELTLCTPLTRLQKFPASQETAWEHTVLYETMTDQPPIPDQGEIESISWHTLEELSSWVTINPEEFAPPFRVLYEWYARQCQR